MRKPEFRRILAEGGLLSEPLTLERGEEANALIYSNPNILPRLRQLGLPDDLRQMKPVETLSALQALRAEGMNRMRAL